MRLIKKLVCKNLKLNKKRTVVTIIGIILSVALLSALSTLVFSFQQSMIAYQKQKGGDFHAAFMGAEREDLSTFEKNRGIESFFTLSNLGYAPLQESKNESKPYCRVLATDRTGMEKSRLTLIKGRYPENENEIVIPRHLKTNGRVEYKIGDTITLQLGTRVAKENGKKLGSDEGYANEYEELVNPTTKEYKIVGEIERAAYGIEPYECPAYTFFTYEKEPTNDIGVYARLNKNGIKNKDEVVAGILGVDAELFAKITGTNTVDVTDKDLEEFSEQLAKSKYKIYVNSWLISYENLWPIDSMFMVIFILAAVVTFIIIFTSVYCIKNSFDISISEKIRQYGMLSSIGATKKQIRRSVHTEAAIMGAVGIPIGVLSGLLATFVLLKISNILLSESLNFELVFCPSIIAIFISVMLGMITIYFSAAGSARKASKVSPMEAIRNQKEIKLSAKNIRAPKYVSRIWGIGGVISYKNIKRNRKKYRTTVVSIVICTVTFIVISYFMSMAMDLVGTAYADERYNVSLSIRSSEDFNKELELAKGLDNIQEYSAVKFNYMNCQNAEYSEEYMKYLDNYGMVTNDVSIGVLVLDQSSYKRYEKECSISHSDDNIILVNGCVVNWAEDKKPKTGEVSAFKYKKGDTIELYDIDDSEAKFDENDELIEDSIKRIDYPLEISVITNVRPMGYKAAKESPMIVMNEKKAKEINLDNYSGFEIFFVSDKADKLQDDLEEIVQKCSDSNAGYPLYNRDKNAREERSLFILLAIFAYGLIAVIALIGITNIINTLSTSMELRSREFATLRSVGMTDSQFRKMVRLESIFTSSKSLIIGVTIGMLISYAINRIECTYDTIIPFNPPIFSAIIAIVIVFVLIYSIIWSSMKRINDRNIIETIKNENL